MVGLYFIYRGLVSGLVGIGLICFVVFNIGKVFMYLDLLVVVKKKGWCFCLIVGGRKERVSSNLKFIKNYLCFYIKIKLKGLVGIFFFLFIFMGFKGVWWNVFILLRMWIKVNKLSKVFY